MGKIPLFGVRGIAPCGRDDALDQVARDVQYQQLVLVRIREILREKGFEEAALAIGIFDVERMLKSEQSR